MLAHVSTELLWWLPWFCGQRDGFRWDHSVCQCRPRINYELRNLVTHQLAHSLMRLLNYPGRCAVLINEMKRNRDTLRLGASKLQLKSMELVFATFDPKNDLQRKILITLCWSYSTFLVQRGGKSCLGVETATSDPSSLFSGAPT